MAEWNEYTLGALTVNHNGLRRPVKSSERVHGSIPYYGASGIVDWVDGYTHDGEYLLISEDGENLRSRSTSIAFRAIGRIWVNNHAHVVSGKNTCDTRFLEYALAVTDISGYLTGSAQPKLTKAAMESIRLRLPPIEQREAIAEVLGALDDKIAANERCLRLMAALSRSLVISAGEDRASVRIGDAASLVTRGVTPKYRQSDGAIVLNQKCVRDHRIDLKYARRMEPLQSKTERLLRPDDALVNSTGQGTLGRVARWTRADPGITVDSHITIVRFDDSVVDPACAGVAMLGLEEQIVLLAEGSTGQTELRRDLLGALELRLPPLEQQRVLGRKLRDLDGLTTAYRDEIDRLAATRDELLPLLMSGKIQVRRAEKIAEGSCDG